MIAKHRNCTWSQLGNGVYCLDHGERLYTGQIPDGDRDAFVEALQSVYDAAYRRLRIERCDHCRAPKSNHEDGWQTIEADGHATRLICPRCAGGDDGE